MEEKKKKALDLHLSFIVDQTEKYSSWLTAGLQHTDGSRTSSLASDAEGSMDSGEGESCIPNDFELLTCEIILASRVWEDYNWHNAVLKNSSHALSSFTAIYYGEF